MPVLQYSLDVICGEAELFKNRPKLLSTFGVRLKTARLFLKTVTKGGETLTIERGWRPWWEMALHAKRGAPLPAGNLKKEFNHPSQLRAKASLATVLRFLPRIRVPNSSIGCFHVDPVRGP